MIVKTMDQEKFCKNCKQISDCQKVYQHLGSVRGPSVVVKVIMAFLLPLVVFIGCLAVFQQFLGKALNIKELNTFLSFLLAISVTFSMMLIIKVLQRQAGKNR